MCKFNCGCTRKYIPLTVAFGKTIHTFQGMIVEPVNEGHEPNPIKRIIVDPGTRMFEGNSPGIMYTLLSRASTLGKSDDKFSSAIYFTGANMNENRIQNITMSSKQTEYEKVKLRKKWTQYLEKNIEKDRLTDEEMNNILQWAMTTKLTAEAKRKIYEKHMY